jgi:hypothetical protein
MKLFVVVLGALLLLAVAAFSVFGFLATFEPTSNALAFRVGYAVVFVGSLISTGLLIRSVVRG